jgi:hypothetical protein
MTSPVENMFAPALAAWKLWLQMAETTRASGTVLAKRSAIIDHAMRDPLHSDIAELSRMVPEKIAAFSRSSAVFSRDWLHIQRLSFEQVMDGMEIARRAVPPTIADFQRTGARAMTIMGLINQAATRALAPIHASVTANEKRLG